MSGRAKFTNLLFWSVKNGNSFLRPNDQLDLSRDGPICLDEGYVYLKCTWLNNQSTQVKKKMKKMPEWNYHKKKSCPLKKKILRMQLDK